MLHLDSSFHVPTAINKLSHTTQPHVSQHLDTPIDNTTVGSALPVHVRALLASQLGPCLPPWSTQQPCRQAGQQRRLREVTAQRSTNQVLAAATAVLACGWGHNALLLMLPVAAMLERQQPSVLVQGCTKPRARTHSWCRWANIRTRHHRVPAQKCSVTQPKVPCMAVQLQLRAPSASLCTQRSH